MDGPPPASPLPDPPLPELPVRVRLATEPLGLMGSLRVARRNLLELIPEIALHAPMISGRTGKRWHMLMDPGALRHVLRDRVEDYPKSDVTKLLLGPAIGESLFVAEGAAWRWQRRAAAPAFAARNVAALGPVMTRAAEHSAARIDRARGAGAGAAVNVFDEMVSATFEVIADVTLSGQAGAAGGSGFDRDAVHRGIDAYMRQSARVSLLDMLGAPGWVPRPSRLGTGTATRAMRQMADAAIAARAAAGPQPVPDLLDLLRAGQDAETGRAMDAGALRDNLLTFIVAGHETTALTLAWSLYLCGFDPGVQGAARQEAQAALGRRAATAEDLPALPLIRRIIEEALRLYPPAAFLSRTARVADEILGREIRPGDTVMLPVYALHRHHALWHAPHRFDPDRFIDRGFDRFAFLPFGDGPRVCIGAAFALQEAVIILATLLARFRFAPAAGHAPPRPALILTLRPAGGVWMEVSPA